MGRVFANGPGVQSQVASYQRLKKWYLIPPCLTLSIIMYVSSVRWSNPGEGVAPSPTPQCSSYWKGSLRITLDNGRQLYFTYNTTCPHTTIFPPHLLSLRSRRSITFLSDAAYIFVWRSIHFCLTQHTFLSIVLTRQIKKILFLRMHW